MNRRWTVLGILLLTTGIGAWFFWPEPGPRATSKFAEATFTRPMSLAPLAPEFEIEIADVNALTDVPVVATNRKERMKTLMPPLTPGILAFQSLVVVARLHNTEEDFSYVDFSTDTWVSGGGNQARDPEQRRMIDPEIQFRLAPGDYFVRYYRLIRSSDREERKPPVVELIGKGRLKVIAAEDGSPGNVPLANKSTVAKIFVKE